MRKVGISSFFRSFALNLLLYHWGTVFAIVMLIMHFTLGVPIWFFWVALAGWICVIAVFTLLMFRINSCNDIREPVKENKNPYSKKGYVPYKYSQIKR